MKKILSVLLCLSTLFGIYGCNSDSKDTDKKTTEITNDDTTKMSSLEKRKNIKDLKEAIPDPEDYLENDEQITRENYVDGNNLYEYFIDNSSNRTDLFDKYVNACKDAGYTLDYYQNINEETEDPNNLSIYSGKLITDESYSIWVQYSHASDYVWITIQRAL